VANPIKRLRWVFGLALLGGTAYVTWLLMQADIQPAAPIIEREARPQGEVADEGLAEAPAITESSTCLEGFEGERFESVRGLSAGLACTLDDGSWTLDQGVTFKLAGEGANPPITVTSNSGTVPADADGVTPLVLTGDVAVEGEDGFGLETEELELYRMRTLVISRGPVVFRRGDASGTAGSLEHDWGAKQTLLDGGATLLLAGDEIGDRPITVKGAKVRLIDERGLIEVRGRGSIDLDGGRVSGERIDATLSKDRRHVRRVEASGAAETLAAGSGIGLQVGSIATRRLRAGRIVHVLSAENALESIEAEASVVLSGQAVGAGGQAATELLQAEWARMSFGGGKDSRLERVEAKGAPARLLSEEGAARREATGETVELGLRADGSLERLAAAGDARLLFRGAGGERTLVGDEVAVGMRGDAIETLDFRGSPADVVQVSQGPTGPETRRMRAAEGHLVFGPDSLPIEGTLTGAVEFSSGEFRAAGSTATVGEGGNQLTLQGDAALIGPGRESHGDSVIFRRLEETVAVVGDQHTILTRTDAGSSLGDFVSGDEPVLISAERMDADLKARRIVYSSPTGGGRPDVRQGDVGLRGDEITLDEAAGDLIASGAVESKLRLVKPDGRARTAGEGLFDPTALIVGTSAEFRYRQTAQIVLYEGDVLLKQGTMELSGQEVEVGLKGEGSEVEYLKARQRALYRGTQFQAEGELIDFRQDENLVRVEGGRRPARAVREGGDLVTGGTLELHLDEDGILVTAPHGGRTRGMSSLEVAEKTP
jgi:lipopolysaccharide export system protein LptA